MKVILKLPDNCPLTSEEVTQVRLLLRDALGEFISARGGRGLEEPAASIGYVNKRYPELQGFRREQKIDEVLGRKQLAQKLAFGVDDLEIE